MCSAEVGPSKAPIAMPLQSCMRVSSGSQKREALHVEQKPRRAFSDDRNHLALSAQ
ncbi:hypothetical protein [Myxococcus xanthus]|uniref:hypothetical protein n=1 Tax=Myxococcus xanthus TaxID=34 RepID=UPI0013761BB6|nr:hypothetical protein [Myxococcus xanthus]